MAALAVLAASATPAPAQTGTTLASNTDQGNGFVNRTTMAQSFTTGSQDATIWEIKLGTGSGFDGTPVVKLRKDNSGEPGDLVAELTHSPAKNSYFRGWLTAFTAPDDTTVDANTTYWVTVSEGVTGSRPAIRLATNDQTGWSIGDGRKQIIGDDGKWSDDGDSIVLAIRGTLGLTVTISGGSAATEGGPAEFMVAANEAPSADLVVNLTVSESADSDFVASADEGSQTVTISAGDTTAAYSVSTQADATHEPNGTVTVAVAPGTGYSVGRTSSAGVTVIDDHDTAPSAPAAPTVSVGSSTSLSVSWSAPSDLGSASSITDYDLRYFAGTSDPANEADWIEEGETNGSPDPGSATSARITRLTAGTTYRVQVRALGDLESPWSASGSGAPMNRAPRLLEEAPQMGGVRSCRVKTDTGTPADQQNASVDTLVHAGPLATRGSNDTGEFPASCSNQSDFVAPFFDDPDGDTLTFSHGATVPDHVRFFQNTPKIAGSPPRLSFDGVAALRQTDFRVDLTATDPHGEAATTHALFRMPIAVGNTNGAPTFGDTVSSKNYVVNQEIVELQLPAASGGDDHVRDGENVFGYFYEVTGLPAGLSFDAATRKITGTPTTVGGPTTVTYTADDADDETLANDTASLTFTITVATTDTTAPTLSTVAVTDGQTLTLTFDENLDAPGAQALDDLRDVFLAAGLYRNGVYLRYVSPASVAVSGPTVTLGFPPHVEALPGRDVEVSYSATGFAVLQDASGNKVADFTRTVTRAVSGTVPPVLASAQVAGAALTLTFDSALDASSAPAGERFSVWHAQGLFGKSSVVYGTGTASVSGTMVTVTLAEAVPSYSGAMLYYVKGDDANPLRAASAGPEVTDILGFPGVAVLDAEVPKLVSASVAGTSLVLTYGEALDTGSRPAAGDFTVTAAGTAQTVSGVAMARSAVKLTLGASVAANAAVTVTYTPGTNPVRDVAGNEAANLSGKAVTNLGPTDLGKPALVSAAVSSRVLTLTFSQELDPSHVPAASAFSFSAGAASVTGVTVRGTKAKLVINPFWHPCLEGLALTYAKPAANALRNVWGTETDGFSGQAVTNALGEQCVSGVLVRTAEIRVVREESGGMGMMALQFDRRMDRRRSLSRNAFSVTPGDAGAPPVEVDETRLSQDGYWLELALSRAPVPGERMTMSYRRPSGGGGLWDADGNQINDFSVEAAAPAAPSLAFASASVNGSTLTVTFDEALDAGSAPAGSAFTVTAMLGPVGPPRAIAGTGTTSVEGATVTVTLAEAVLGGDTAVTVAYAPPDENPLRDLAGNTVAAFSGEAAENETPAVDPGAPRLKLTAATVNGAKLTLAFDDRLHWRSVPRASDFTVKVNDNEVSLRASNPVSVSTTMVTLTLAAAVDADDEVTVSYRADWWNPIQSLTTKHGYKYARNFTDQPVTNVMVDGTAPTPYRATVDGAKLTLIFTEQLDTNAEPAPSAFTVTKNGKAVSFRPYSLTINGKPRPVLQDPVPVSMIGASVTLTLSAPVGDGDAVEVRYAQPVSGAKLQDLAGNAVAGFDATVENRTETSRPGFRSATADGVTLTVTFDEPLDEGSAPAGSAFTVTAAPAEGAARTIAGTGTAGVEGAAVSVRLAETVVHGETLTVAYAPPGTDAIRDLAGKRAPAFSGEAVTNETAPPAPSVTGVAVVSDPGADATYAAGDTVRVQVTFGAAVTVDTEGGVPRLKLDLDPADGGERWAAYEGGSGTAALVFGYAATAGDTSRGGVAVLGNTLELNGGTIGSAVTQDDAVLAHEGLDHDAAHKVDTAGPALASATVSGSALTVVFDEALDAASAPPAHAFAVAVDAPGSTRHRVVPGTGEVAVEGAQVRVTLAGPVVHGPPVTVAYGPLVEGAAGLRDVAGNEAVVFSGRPAVNATPAPAVTGTVNGGRLVLTFPRDLLPAQGPAPAGSAFTVRALRPDGPPVRTIAGTERVLIAGATVTVTLTEAVWPGDAVTVSYAPSEGTPGLRDLGGRKVAAFSGAPVANETPVPVPSVWKADVMQDAGPDGVWTEGETVTAMVVFTSSVRVDLEGGRPTLALIAGGSVRRVPYAGGTGAGLLFRYRVSEADGALRAVRVAASGLKSNGGAIVSAADGTPALLGFGEAPGVTAVAIADEPDGRWEAGDTVEATLAFAEPVAVEGAPSVGLVLEGAVKRAVYAGGSGSDALTFRYTLGDDDGPWSRAVLVSNTLDAGDGSIVSAGGGLAAALGHLQGQRTLEAPPVPAPAVTAVAVVSDAGGDDTYALGDTIRVQVTFSEAVSVDAANGTPRLKIKMDPTWGEFWAGYESGGGTAVLTFVHEVAEPNTSPRGIAVLAGTLVANGGAIRSAATGADAALAHAGLAHDPAHKVDWRLTPPAAAPPLTASFVGMPEEHDGKSLFTFELRFNEDFPGRLRYKLLRDEAFEVTNGRVRKAKRVAQRQNQRWNISVRPDSHEDVVVRLPAATDCAAPGAVCTEAGRKLSNTVSATVRGPALLSVADARAREGVDPAVVFPVTLSRAASGVVTVEYVTRDGTAKAGEDYERTRGTLTFAVGETEKTVAVPVLDDGHDEGAETFTLKLRNADGAWLVDDEATGTIENSDPIPKAWLARFGRTVTGHVLDAVEARLAAPRQAGAEAALAGQALPSWSPGPGSGAGPGAANDNGSGAGAQADRAALTDVGERDVADAVRRWMAFAGADDRNPGRISRSGGVSGFGDDPAPGLESRTLTQRDLLTGTSFTLTARSGGPGGGFASLWGRGAVSSFDGREGNLTLDGEVTTGLIGADWSSDPGSRNGSSGSDRWTVGLAIGHSTGTGGYRTGNCAVGNCGGKVEAELTGLYPYAGAGLTDRLSVWASAGHGAGEVTVRPDGVAPFAADLTMSMGAAGLRSEVLKPAEAGGLSLALKGEGHVTRTESEAAANADGGRLAAAEADVWMLRTGIEGSRAFALTGAGSGTGGDGKGRASITPSFEIGVRVDGGDAETGFGADMGGGLAFADSANGISLDMKARALVAHKASGFREWGASASVGWDPRPETDRGLALSLTRSLGASPSGGMDALLSRETLADLAANDDGNGSGFEASGRTEGEIGYGLPAFGGGFTGTPNLGFGLSDNGTRDYRIGWRLTSAVPGAPGFEVTLDATRREPANDNGAGTPVEHGVMLRSAIRW